MTAPRLRLERIEAARAAIPRVFLGGPCFECETLVDALEGATAGGPSALTLKVECLNPVRSFKGRGAELFMARDAPDGPLVCASAGNFGQAMAYACRARGVPLTVVAAVGANRLKVDRMRSLGARVVLEGDDFDAAKEAARGLVADGGGSFVEDGREVAISEGAGTIALELLEGCGALDVLLVPLGNGALAAGVGTVLRARAPGLRVVAVAAAGASAMVRSLRESRLVADERTSTIADGIAVRVPVPEAVADLRDLVDETLLVDEDAILAGMRLLHRHAGLVVEGAGAVGVAALLREGARFAGLRVATIVTGGNLTPEQVRACLCA